MIPFFEGLTSEISSLSDLVPKLINFVSIVFRYQNKQVIIEEQEDIKLGLEDTIDLQKELLTLLELVWVNKYVKLPYSRYSVKMNITKFHSLETPEKPTANAKEGDNFIDLMSKEIIKSTDINNYNLWRKYIKAHSEGLVSRAPSKFKDLEHCHSYQLKSSSDVTLSYLNRLYHTKKSIP